MPKNAFDPSTLDFVKSTQDNSVVAQYLARKFTENPEGGAYWCTGCFGKKKYPAQVGGAYLYVNPCAQHGGRDCLIDLVRQGLNASQKERAYPIGDALYNLVLFSEGSPGNCDRDIE